VRSNFCSAKQIIASEPNENTRAALRRDVDIAITAENAEAAEKGEIILLGVKPAMVLPTIRELTRNLQDKVVISLAAGVRISSMEKIVEARFIRAMTNTPSAVCRAATALARGTRTTGEDVDRALAIFSAIGVVVELDEDKIDTVTALCGSGPAFIYTVIKALADGGEKMGLAPNVALTLATQTVLGAAQLASETKMSPEELIKMVVTPGGTTAAGLAVMEKLKTSEGLIAAVQAATERGKGMAQENS
jgi:pyrroline-5-carboxylate reductase